MTKSEFFDCGLKLIAIYLGITSAIQFIQMSIMIAAIGSIGGMPGPTFTVPAGSSLLVPVIQMAISIMIFIFSTNITNAIFKSSQSER